METKRMMLKSLAVAASAILVFTGCNKREKESASDRSGDSLSQGTGYGGQGAGMGGAQDRTGTASERDTDFEKSFYGPTGWDWRFTPGTSIYDFEKKGIGGTGSDSSAHANSAEAGKSRKRSVHDPALDSMNMRKDGMRMMMDS